MILILKFYGRSIMAISYIMYHVSWITILSAFVILYYFLYEYVCVAPIFSYA